MAICQNPVFQTRQTLKNQPFNENKKFNFFIDGNQIL